MTSEDRHDIAVVGAGGAGTMAYLRGVLNGDRTVLFTGDAQTKRKGRSTWVMHVDNIPGMHEVSRPIGSTSRSTLDWIAGQEVLKELGSVEKGAVERIERLDEGFRLHWSEKGEARSLDARFVVLATGIMDRQPEIGGSIKPILPYANRGDALYWIRCDGHKTIGRRLSVLGASDSAIWIATMMADRYGHERIPMLTHGLEETFSDKVLELARAYDMTIHRGEITEVLGDPKRALEGFELAGGERVETDQVIVSLGVIIYNDLLKGLDAELDDAGRPVVSERFETSIPGLFAAGDMVPGKKLQVYTAWDVAVDAVDEINGRLRAEKRAARLAAAGGH